MYLLTACLVPDLFRIDRAFGVTVVALTDICVTVYLCVTVYVCVCVCACILCVSWSGSHSLSAPGVFI